MGDSTLGFRQPLKCRKNCVDFCRAQFEIGHDGQGFAVSVDPFELILALDEVASVIADNLADRRHGEGVFARRPYRLPDPRLVGLIELVALF